MAANNAAAGGVVAIAASGNENNSNSMGSPACACVNVIAVGMTWKNDYPTCEDQHDQLGLGHLHRQRSSDGRCRLLQ